MNKKAIKAKLLGHELPEPYLDELILPGFTDYFLAVAYVDQEFTQKLGYYQNRPMEKMLEMTYKSSSIIVYGSNDSKFFGTMKIFFHLAFTMFIGLDMVKEFWRKIIP